MNIEPINIQELKMYMVQQVGGKPYVVLAAADGLSYKLEDLIANAVRSVRNDQANKQEQHPSMDKT